MRTHDLKTYILYPGMESHYILLGIEEGIGLLFVDNLVKLMLKLDSFL